MPTHDIVLHFTDAEYQHLLSAMAYSGVPNAYVPDAEAFIKRFVEHAPGKGQQPPA